MTLHLAADAPLLQAFATLPDPRKSRNQIYPLIDIVGVAIIGILGSANDWVTVVRWANAHLAWFQSVGLCFNGVPSHDTIGRFFRLVDPKAFESCFTKWVRTLAKEIQGVIATDGKTTTEKRYYISSLLSSAERLSQIIRSYWAIEVKLHWHLDVSFNEGKSKVRAGHGAENFSLLKRYVLNLIKADTTEKASVSLKRRMAELFQTTPQKINMHLNNIF